MIASQPQNEAREPYAVFATNQPCLGGAFCARKELFIAVSDWSTTPASNATQPGINMATGAPPSSVHPGIRQIMADVAAAGLLGGSVKASGAKIDGATDDTAAFNIATSSATAWTTALYRVVNIPAGISKVGGGNVSIIVRKGQTLRGAGFGAITLDASATNANTAPTVQMALSTDTAETSSGQAIEVAGMTFLGGPTGRANIDTTGVAGWKIHDVFFSGPGVGVSAAGGDGQLHGCIFDIGLNHIVVSGGNLLIHGNHHYLGSYQVTFNTGAYDVTLSNSQFEYFNYAAVLFNTGTTNVKNVKIVNCNFVQNVQYGTTVGAVLIASIAADALISGCTFRNINGNAIAYSTGVGNTLVIEGCVFDGNKTLAGYAQSTTMGGVDCTNMAVVIRNCVFRNLPGQPITFGGTLATTVVIDSCRFENNTGGTTDINVTNINASKLIIRNCTSTRALVNTSATVSIAVNASIDSANGVVASAAALVIPKTRDVLFITGTTGITSISADSGNAYRTVQMIFGGSVTLTNGTNLLLLGGANFAAVVNSTLTLSSQDGTAWYEVGRKAT